MTEREALKLALDAFGEIAWSNETQWQRDRAKEAITVIKKALAQPEQKSDGVALTNIPHPNGAPAPDDLNADALEVVELELPDEDEAVGWADGGVINWIAGKQFKHASYLYATPPQRKPLTENEIKHLWYEACQTNLELTSQLIVHLARNIEKAHGIKENT